MFYEAGTLIYVWNFLGDTDIRATDHKTQNSKISTTLMKKIIESKVEKIYLALDEDALKDAFNHAETFLSYGKKVYLIEMGDKDPSELGFEAFTKLLHKATKLTTSTLMKKRLALS